MTLYRTMLLGDIIQAIESAGTKNEDGEDKYVVFDFASVIPTHLDSWRGDYSHLALGCRFLDPCEDYPTAEEFLTELKSAVGKTYQGWKGGRYVMTEKTPVWVDNPGNYTCTRITGIIDHFDGIIIQTAYFKD